MSTDASRQAPLVEVDIGFQSQKLKPVKWFAAVGVICLLVQVYPYSRWILSGPRPTEAGPDHIPGWMTLTANLMQGIGPFLMIATGYFLVWRPWRRDGRMSLYGMAFFAVLTSYWVDTAANYFNHVYTINPVLVNFGSWNNYLPFWGSPNAEHLAEPFLLFIPIYCFGIVLPAVGFCALMRYIRGRRPGIGNLRLVGVIYAIAVGAMFILDGIIYVRTGMYVFAGTLPSLTIFQGEFYQYPLYQPFICAFLYWVAPATIYFFRNDRGETLIERGLTSMRVSSRQGQWLRFLAVAGMFNLIQITYSVFMALVSVMPTFAWADDIVDNRSYLRNELCGDGTSYACPAGDIPIPRIGGAHVNPDGKLVIPDGAQVP
ncbi:spirocyclase AveC family protein [Mycolicibacterium sp. 624]|uniref:spirocyclase AveC family protein n=1 Tax=Mycolicibacterium sp. 624 TaxID=3156314 RepID=UPI0033911656